VNFAESKIYFETAHDDLVPRSRILDSSNIHIPLNPADTASSAVFTSSDALDITTDPDLQKSDRTFENFAFEWNGVSQEDPGLAGQVDDPIDESVPSLNHVPTFLNAIEEVSEEDDILRRSITIGVTTDSSLAPTETLAHGEQGTNGIEDSHSKKSARNRGAGLGCKILNRCRKLPSFIHKNYGISIHAQTEEPDQPVSAVRRPRNKLRKIRPIATTLPTDLTTTVSLGPSSMLSFTATTYAFCRPVALFSRNTFGSKRKPVVSELRAASSDTLGIVAEVVRESRMDSDSEFGWRGSQELRLCRWHRLHGAGS
jgi:hypothetical protein